MFQYEFMQKALIVGSAIALIIPLIGVIVINERNSMIGDALSHTSLAGVCLGLIIGLNPVIGSIIACVLAAFFIELLQKRMPKNSDLPTAIILSGGIGLAAILSDFVPGGQKLEAFLFGSLVAIKNSEMYLILLVSSLILFLFIKYYNGLIYMIYDEKEARLAGVNTSRLNTLFTLLTGLSIAIASRAVGVLMVSSLMTLPVASAIQWSNSFRQATVLSSLLGLAFTLSGMTISFYLGLKPGGSIVSIGVLFLIFTLIFSKKD